MSSLPTLTFIDSANALIALADQLRKEKAIAVDTESNSLFAYYERVCLIQISTRQADWMVDPLALDTVAPLEPLFADPGIEKVFHAAEYDLMTMKRDFGFTFAGLFDTQYAARVLGIPKVGLGDMLAERFGVRLNKQYQRANWGTRPISEEQLQYAQLDTHYLLPLRDQMVAELVSAGHLVEAQEAFEHMALTPAAQHTFDPDAYWNIRAAMKFTRRQMAILNALYQCRDRLARERDVPPFKIAGDDVLVEITLQMPGSIEGLSSIKGFGAALARRSGDAFLKAVRDGLAAPLPQRPQREPGMDNATLARFTALREWRKKRAGQRGVESDIILPREALIALAERNPKQVTDLASIPGIGPYKLSVYGEELLAVLADIL